jgi:hypothetical protein
VSWFLQSALRKRLSGFLALFVGALALTAIAAQPASAHSSSGHGHYYSSGKAGHQLAQARAATAKYHNIDKALADGYIADPMCVASPEGGMGHHYINPALLEDPAVNPKQPEVLLYAPNKHGRLKLVGVEYVVIDADQDLNTDDDRPYLFGQPFNGPMLGHGPGMPIHYDLHAWIWKHNPSGLFYDWNPRVHCPAAAA